MKTLVFPGSFDPFTNSHLDLALRAQDLFDRVIVAVQTRDIPDARREAEDRAELVHLALDEHEGFEIEIFDGLLVDYLRSRDAQFVLRGMRTIADFEYEFQRVDMTRQLDPEIEFVFLAPSEHCSFLSSKLVREIAAYGRDVSDFVPPAVARELMRRSAE
jgi:pantetheine-phosphate adenylyltransferase